MAYPAWVAPVAMDPFGGFQGGFLAGQHARQGQRNQAGLDTVASIYDQQRGQYAQPQPMGFLASRSQAAAPQPTTPQVSSNGALSGSFDAVQSAVDPTLQAALNTSTGNSRLNDRQREFVNKLMPAAIQASQRTGVDPRIIVAQAAQETGWGRSAPGNNYFGIKSHGQSGGQSLNTHEYVNGQRVNVRDSFRTFGSPEESVMGYADFITRNPRYTDFRNAQGLDAQLAALQASGYATDPNYSQSVGSIARMIGGGSVEVGSPALGAATQMAQAGGQPSAMSFLSSGVPDVGAGQGQPFEITGAQIASLMASEYTRPYGIQLLEARQQTAQSGGRYVVEQGPNGSVWQRDRLSGETKVLLTPDQMGVSSGSAARPMTPEERRTWGIPDNDTRPYMIDADGTPKLLGGSGQTINVSTGDAGAGEFWDTLGGAVTGRYTGLIEAGNGAARTLGQLDQLETLLANTPQGFGAAATQFAGNFGIDLGDAEGVQAAAALINQMVPAQRPPGSGPMSDADLELFKQSVPRLINQPGGNQMIIDTMRAINTYDLQAARIVEDYALRGQRAQTPEEADQLRSEMQTALNALQNPLDNFQQRVQPYLREAEDGDAGSAPIPTVGEIVDGYRFKGGDPANPNSWERVE